MLVLKSADRESETVPFHSIKSTHTKFDILKQFLPNNFLVGIMERRFEEGSSSFTILKRRAAKGGKQKKQTLVEALKEAVAELKEMYPKFRGFG
eukprot:1546209-Ditylum_brightwellii.AAC.1